jgi:hypothetical protein
MADTEGAIWNAVQRKAADHEAMKRQMTNAMRQVVIEAQTKLNYHPTQEIRIPQWLRSAA